MIRVQSSRDSLTIQWILRCDHCDEVVFIRDGVLVAEWNAEGRPLPYPAALLHRACRGAFLHRLRAIEWHAHQPAGPGDQHWREAPLEDVLLAVLLPNAPSPLFTPMGMPVAPEEELACSDGC